MGKAGDDRYQRNCNRGDDQQDVERRQKTHCEKVADFPDHCLRLLLTFESSLNPTNEIPAYPDVRDIAAFSHFAHAKRPVDSAIEASFALRFCPRCDHLKGRRIECLDRREIAAETLDLHGRQLPAAALRE